MGTRSFVGVMVGDKCRAVYVHWDGYLEGVGAELQNYTRQELVEELIRHGDRSSLHGEYYKDRGERGVAPKTYKTFDKFYKAADKRWCEYYYIFKDGVWYCGDTYDEVGGSPITKKLVPYAEAVEALEKDNEEWEDKEYSY